MVGRLGQSNYSGTEVGKLKFASAEPEETSDTLRTGIFPINGCNSL